MNDTPWRQVNIAYPGQVPEQRERQAAEHLTGVLAVAEAEGLTTTWFFIRKGRWRVRYLLTKDADGRNDPLHPLLTAGTVWTNDIYEPETHAFGGPGSMCAAHTLFHLDSRHLLSFLRSGPADRRERSLILCTALMRAAGLDLNEQGDVWAQIADQRDGLSDDQSGPQEWAAFTSGIRHLLLGSARADIIGNDWLSAFERTGRTLRGLRESGTLTRGLRAVIALHVIFHWNRCGLPAATQATLARAAEEAVFGHTLTLRDRWSQM